MICEWATDSTEIEQGGFKMKNSYGSQLLVRAVTVLAAVAALCSAATAIAQQRTSLASSAGNATDEDTELAEVIVTAERRNENLQTTPIAVTVLNKDELVKKGVVQMADLHARVLYQEAPSR
jgi:outer membrane receptor protein involved in Fe transport